MMNPAQACPSDTVVTRIVTSESYCGGYGTVRRKRRTVQVASYKIRDAASC